MSRAPFCPAPQPATGHARLTAFAVAAATGLAEPVAGLAGGFAVMMLLDTALG